MAAVTTSRQRGFFVIAIKPISVFSFRAAPIRPGGSIPRSSRFSRPVSRLLVLGRVAENTAGSAAEAEVVALVFVIVHDRAQDAVERQVAERLLDPLQGRLLTHQRQRALF